MRCRFGLLSLAEQLVAFWSVRQFVSLRPQPGGFLIETFSEGEQLFDTPPFDHGRSFSQRKAGAQPAFSSPIIATNLAVIADNGLATVRFLTLVHY